MAEVQFAKSFLATLDRKPVKLSSDFVSDPRKYPSQSPYILPKPSTTFPKPSSTPTTAASISVSLKPTKPSSPPLTLPSQNPTLITILDLKQSYATHAQLDVSKIKILYNKRPASDLKTLKELLPSPPPAEAELGVMILGGAIGVTSPPPSVPDSAFTPPPPASASLTGSGSGAKQAGDKMDVDSVGPGSEAAGAKAVAAEGAAEQDVKGTEVIKDETFWADLRDFLVQRVRDEKEGERLASVFRAAVR